MRRRLVSLAALSVFALTLGAAPALARGHADHWVVTHSSMDITGFTVMCGPTTYTVISGTILTSEQLKGTLDSTREFASTPGAVIETQTLKDVWVTTGHHKPRAALGSGHLEASWLAGDLAITPGDPGSPWITFGYAENAYVQGTRDGIFVVAVLGGGTLDYMQSGNCTDLHLATEL